MLQDHHQRASTKWKLINFRTVNDFLTAEFLHDLYNRHRPEVNSVRFRNTLCILRGKDFRSYAPQNEWDDLGVQLGRRFYRREPSLLEEVTKYIERDKHILHTFLNSLPEQFTAISDEELFHLLSQLHYLALGEIYGINLVQIEHGLNWAISKHLCNNPKDFSTLPNFEWDSQLRVFEKALLVSSLQITEESKPFEQVIQGLFEKFGHFSNGYGSGINTWEKIKSQLEDLLSIDAEQRKKMLIPNESLAACGSSEYADLYVFASKIAELRDKNKLLMGYVTSKRNTILDTITIRRNLPRSELSRYSLLEINDLIYANKRLTLKTIQERHHLVVLKREEYFYTNVSAESLVRVFFEESSDHSHARNQPIYGTIASKGIVRGKARIVFSHKECEDIQATDILVALGTDFDLLHGIAACAGVITEEGGILSHASVVSRELGKPCLIGIPHLLSFIKEGDLVLLNCHDGYLQIENAAAIDLYGGMELLHEQLIDTNFPSKILNLNSVAKHGLPVLRGVCIPDTLWAKELDGNFFKALSSIFTRFLQTNTLIIRGCTPIEDQKEHSFAGASCSRVVHNDPSSLEAAFHEIRDRGVALENALLVQPFIHFDCGGVAFTDNATKKVLVEMSAQGPFGVVNGKVDHRVIFDMEHLNQETVPADSAEQSLIQAALFAYKIAKLFEYDVDMEWGIEKQNFWVLQARPVTVPCVS